MSPLGDRPSTTEHVTGSAFQFNIQLVCSTGEDDEITEDGLAVVFEHGALGVSDLELAAGLVTPSTREVSK